MQNPGPRRGKKRSAEPRAVSTPILSFPSIPQMETDCYGNATEVRPALHRGARSLEPACSYTRRGKAHTAPKKQCSEGAGDVVPSPAVPTFPSGPGQQTGEAEGPSTRLADTRGRLLSSFTLLSPLWAKWSVCRGTPLFLPEQIHKNQPISRGNTGGLLAPRYLTPAMPFLLTKSFRPIRACFFLTLTPRPPLLTPHPLGEVNKVFMASRTEVDGLMGWACLPLGPCSPF